jgi:hypothetical protein
MPRTCTICRHPKRAEIIAKHFETSWQAVRRHKDHLPDQVVKAHDAKEVARADDLLASITALRERLQTALDHAETARDVASVARELRETFRLMLELEGRLRRGTQVNVGVLGAVEEPKRVEIVTGRMITIPTCLSLCQYPLACCIVVGMDASNGRKAVPKDARITRARAGGLARKRALTKAQREEIARRAVLARYRKSTRAARSEAARKAVQARWARARTNK